MKKEGINNIFFIQKIKKYLAEDELKKSISEILIFLKKKDTSLYDIAIIQSSFYNSIEKQLIIDTVNYETAQQNKAKIMKGIFFLLDKIGRLEEYSQLGKDVTKIETNNSTELNLLSEQSEEINKQIFELQLNFSSCPSKDKFIIKKEIKNLRELKRKIDNKLKKK